MVWTCLCQVTYIILVGATLLLRKFSTKCFLAEFVNLLSPGKFGHSAMTFSIFPVCQLPALYTCGTINCQTSCNVQDKRSLLAGRSFLGENLHIPYTGWQGIWRSRWQTSLEHSAHIRYVFISLGFRLPLV